MNHSCGLIGELSGIAPTGIAVRWGNCEHENPVTGKRTTIPELVEFATGYFKFDCLFREFQEPL